MVYFYISTERVSKVWINLRTLSQPGCRWSVRSVISLADPQTFCPAWPWTDAGLGSAQSTPWSRSTKLHLKLELSTGQCLDMSRCPTQVSSCLRSQYGQQAGFMGCGMDSLNVCVSCTVSRVCPHLWLYKWSVRVGADRRAADVLPVVASFSLCSQTWGLATLMLKRSMHLGLCSSVRKAIVPFPKMSLPLKWL